MNKINLRDIRIMLEDKEENTKDWSVELGLCMNPYTTKRFKLDEANPEAEFAISVYYVDFLNKIIGAELKAIKEGTL